MLHKLKPVPRGLLILAIVGGLGYAALQMDMAKVLPKKEIAETSAEPTVIIVPRAAPQIVNPAQAVAENELQRANAAVAAAQAAAQQAPSGLTAAPVPNAGLDAVLGAGKKK